MNARARNFLAANEVSPVVYGSVDGNCVDYRLANGKMFRLTVVEARQAPNPRWAYLENEMNSQAIAQHAIEESATLDRVLREARA